MKLKNNAILTVALLSLGAFAASPTQAIDASAGGPESADVTLGSSGDAMTDYPLDRMVDLDIYTSGGVEIGSVSSVDEDAGILINSVASNQRGDLNGVDTIAIYASEVDIDRVLIRGNSNPLDGRYSLVRTETRVVLDTTIDDLRASVTAVVSAP